MKIIFPYKEYNWLSLISASADTLEARRERLAQRFFKRSVLPESSWLHHPLPDKRDLNITDRLRYANTFTSFSFLELKDFASHFTVLSESLLAPLYPHRTLWRYTNVVLLLLLWLAHVRNSNSWLVYVQSVILRWYWHSTMDISTLGLVFFIFCYIHSINPASGCQTK